MELNETVLPFDGFPVSLPVSAGLRVDSAIFAARGRDGPRFWKGALENAVLVGCDANQRYGAGHRAVRCG